MKSCGKDGQVGQINDLDSDSGSSGSLMRPQTYEKTLKLWLLAAALLVLAAQPLLARSRDDVLSGMFHCAAIGDTRVWLDCFYGAAQPVRAELGLPAAPPGQVRLSQNPPASVPPAGDLSPRYLATADALHCNSILGDREWLDCYYSAAQHVRAQLGLSPAPRAPVQANGANPSVLNSPSQPSGARATPSEVARNPGWSQVASYSFDRHGIFTIALVNGQKWQQLSGDTDLAHWVKPASNYWVRVSRGALNSLNLKVKGEATAYKVGQIN
jgi:hypothetical protein